MDARARRRRVRPHPLAHPVRVLRPRPVRDELSPRPRTLVAKATGLRAASAERTITVPAPDGSLVAFQVQPVQILANDLREQLAARRRRAGRADDAARP
ncbi:hypothetical protein [Microbacterium testaceum]|uniref:hypothetical protein n=1 Tax=Microbacterium testaceum TaxID=2033 RepID=UPI001248E121|nr:hypothetical protein [Microbacterium testaceum]